ncbi:MAG TPA: lactonase family protein [Polyangiales bacterium]|nr:lactonase family protein [Polyangiales bacterium]
MSARFGTAQRARPRGAGHYVYVGTYTAPGTAPGGREPSTAEGIYVFRMEPRDGNLSLAQVVPASNPSYLALDASLTRLYCVNEDDTGQVSAFSIDAARGTLQLLNLVASNGIAPTHLSVHPSGRYVLAANYGSGSCPVFPIRADGSLGPMTDLFQSAGNGTGPNPNRQDGPHAHHILTDPAAQHVFAVDLGADKINVLQLALDSGTLTPNQVPFAPLASGSGPRHLAFHMSEPRAYVLNELASSVTVFEYDAERGAMTWLQTISALPARFSGDNTAGEIRIHPDGRFLYTTNRGHDSIASFAIDPSSGRLDSLGWQATDGEWPRGMNIDPTGSFLYAANQNTNSIAVFRIQRSNGRLQQTGLITTPTPSDVAFGRPIDQGAT